MENPNLSQQAIALPSLTSILKKISENKAHVSGLLEAGLIKRHKSTYSLTLLGKVVYDSQIIIGEAHYWKLKAIETIEVSSNLSVEEVTQLINTLINNPRIKDILMRPTDIPCDY